jgi:hypothetical protein
VCLVWFLSAPRRGFFCRWFLFSSTVRLLLNRSAAQFYRLRFLKVRGVILRYAPAKASICLLFSAGWFPSVGPCPQAIHFLTVRDTIAQGIFHLLVSFTRSRSLFLCLGSLLRFFTRWIPPLDFFCQGHSVASSCVLSTSFILAVVPQVPVSDFLQRGANSSSCSFSLPWYFLFAPEIISSCRPHPARELCSPAREWSVACPGAKSGAPPGLSWFWSDFSGIFTSARFVWAAWLGSAQDQVLASAVRCARVTRTALQARLQLLPSLLLSRLSSVGFDYSVYRSCVWIITGRCRYRSWITGSKTWRFLV